MHCSLFEVKGWNNVFGLYSHSFRLSIFFSRFSILFKIEISCKTFEIVICTFMYHI